MPNPLQVGTNHPFKIASQCFGLLANEKGYFVNASFNGDQSNTLPTATSTFAAGCFLQNTRLTSSVTTATAVWVNTGSATTPTWTVLNIN